MIAPQARITLIWLVAAMACALLAIIALGISTDFYDLRLGILASLAFLGALSFLLGYWEFGVAWIAVGIFFNPVVPVHIPRYDWTILDTLLFAAILYFAHWATDSYKKGTRFEKYVSTLFPEPDFRIVDRTRDISKDTERRVESDMHPDFIFRKRATGELFAVECKWHGRWARGNKGDLGLWWKLEQGERYAAFGRAAQMPVFVAFGVGGSPEKPKEIYFLELERLRFPFLYQSLIHSGKRAGEL